MNTQKQVNRFLRKNAISNIEGNKLIDEIEEIFQRNKTILQKDDEEAINSSEPEIFVFPEVPENEPEILKLSDNPKKGINSLM